MAISIASIAGKLKNTSVALLLCAALCATVYLSGHITWWAAAFFVCFALGACLSSSKLDTAIARQIREWSLPPKPPPRSKSPRIEIKPQKGRLGTTFEVCGENFTYNGRVQVDFSGKFPNPIWADVNGKFKFSVDTTSGFGVGYQHMRFVDLKHNEAATDSFEILAPASPPKPTVSPSKGKEGTKFVITCTNCTPGELIFLDLPGKPTFAERADRYSGEVKFIVDTTVGYGHGLYRGTIKDSDTGKSAGISFEVETVSPPKPSVSPSKGKEGTKFVITCTNCTPGELIFLDIPGKPTLAERADRYSGEVKFVVDTTTGYGHGSYRATIKDRSTGIAAVVIFEVEIVAQPDILNDRFQIARKLATGGMAEIYLARDMDNSMPCILKKAKKDPDPAMYKIFQDKLAMEDAVLRELVHPNIVKRIDSFSHNHEFFLVEEYIDGVDMLQAFKHKPADESRAIKFMCQLLDVLSFIHKKKYVNRDYNPGNMMLCNNEDTVIVIDFGTIRVSGVEGTIVEKIGFNVPETAARGYADERSDVYAAGGTLYYLLTSTPPSSIGNKDIIDVLTKRGISQNTAMCVKQALQMDPDRRFQNATVMKKALLLRIN